MPGHSHFRVMNSRRHSVGTGSGTIYSISVPSSDTVGSAGLPFWKEPVTLYWPNQIGTSTPVVASTCITGLHGGSGTATNFARNLGFLKSPIVNAANVDWDYLARAHGPIAIPNGMFCTRGALAGYPNNTGQFNPNGVETVSPANPQGIRTWSAGMMWSGQQDIQFLNDWATWIINDPMGLGLGPSIGRALFGHSNGGMMAQYMWRNWTTSYTKYGGISCPLVDDAYTGGASGTDPTNGRIFCAFYGGSDDVINLYNGPAGPGDHFYDNDTLQATIANTYPDPGTGSVADVLYNPLVSPYFFPNQYVGPYKRFVKQINTVNNNTNVPTPTVATMANGAIQTTWIDTASGHVLQVVSGAGHDIMSQEQTTGRRRLSDLVNAWAGNYSALNPGV